MAFALLPSGLIAAAGQMVEELSGRAAPSQPQPPRKPPWLAFAPYERFGRYETAAAFTPGIGTFYHPMAKGAVGSWSLPWRLPVYIFACGTYQISIEYAPTLHHIASHGILVLGVQDAKTKVMTPAFMDKVVSFVRNGALMYSALPAQLRGRIDSSRLAVGGHSGGGPVALQAAAELVRRFPSEEGGRPVVQGFVAQHAAAIPEDNPQRLKPNRPSEEHLQALAADGTSMLSLCGTLDQMPYCSCDHALRDYFDRFDGPKLLIKVLGAVHMTSGAAGERAEAAYVLAYLLSVLRDDEHAASALTLGKGNDDIIYYQLEHGVSPTIVTFGHEYQAIESELLWHAANHTAAARPESAHAANHTAALSADDQRTILTAAAALAASINATAHGEAAAEPGGTHATAATQQAWARHLAAVQSAAPTSHLQQWSAAQQHSAAAAEAAAATAWAAQWGANAWRGAGKAAGGGGGGGGGAAAALQQRSAGRWPWAMPADWPHLPSMGGVAQQPSPPGSVAAAAGKGGAKQGVPGVPGAPSGGASGAALMRATQHVLSHLPQIATSKSMRLPLLLPKRLATSIHHTLAALPGEWGVAPTAPRGAVSAGRLVAGAWPAGGASSHRGWGGRMPGQPGFGWAAGVHPLLPPRRQPWPPLAAAAPSGMGAGGVAARRGFGVSRKWGLPSAQTAYALVPFGVRDYSQAARQQQRRQQRLPPQPQPHEQPSRHEAAAAASARRRDSTRELAESHDEDM